eukprot:3956205-Pleurochrysis_carterae.AAC.1
MHAQVSARVCALLCAAPAISSARKPMRIESAVAMCAWVFFARACFERVRSHHDGADAVIGGEAHGRLGYDGVGCRKGVGRLLRRRVEHAARRGEGDGRD